MIGTLVKNRLRAVFGSALNRAGRGKKIEKPSPAKLVLFAFLYVFLIAVFLILSMSVSLMLAPVLLPGADWLYYLIYMCLSITLIFILSIFETKTELFDCKDNDLLLSMPIKPKDIVAARVIIVLIYNYIINAVLMIPAIVFYALFANNIVGIIGGILIFLLLPLFATALASFVGYLVAEVSRKLKYKNLITVIITFSLFALYFVMIDFIGNNLEAMLEALLVMGEEFAQSHKVLLFFGNAALLKPLSILSVAAISILSAIIAYYLISSAYIRIVTERTGAKKAVYKEKRLKRGSAIAALTKKDIRHFFSSPIYTLNGAIGLIMGIVLGVVAIVNADSLRTIAADLEIPGAALANIATALVILTFSMTIISACSLSLEGKQLWIMKTMPISPKCVLLSKALMQFIISAPIILISTVLMLIATQPSPALWIVYIIIAQLANLSFSLLGILVNVLFPKFDYENEAQAVKQSLATIVSMMLCMLISMALLIGTFILSIINFALGIALLAGAFALLLPIEFVLLLYPMADRYKRLDM